MYNNQNTLLLFIDFYSIHQFCILFMLPLLSLSNIYSEILYCSNNKTKIKKNHSNQRCVIFHTHFSLRNSCKSYGLVFDELFKITSRAVNFLKAKLKEAYWTCVFISWCVLHAADNIDKKTNRIIDIHQKVIWGNFLDKTV